MELINTGIAIMNATNACKYSLNLYVTSKNANDSEQRQIRLKKRNEDNITYKTFFSLSEILILIFMVTIFQVLQFLR